MKIDLLKYKNNLNTVKTYLSSNSKLSFEDKLTNICLMTNMPLIVVAFFISKIEGQTEDFEKAVARFNRFYKYDEVLNLEEFMKL